MMDKLGSLDSSRDLEPIRVKSFINRYHLVLLNAKILFPKFLENGTKQDLIYTWFMQSNCQKGESVQVCMKR